MTVKKEVNIEALRIKAVGFAKSWAKEEFDFDFTIPLEVNKRLTRALGRFISYPASRKSEKIELSEKLLKYHTWEVVESVIKHELIHHILFEKGLPYHDGHPYFEEVLKLFGSHTTGTIQFKGVGHEYRCMNCDKSIVKRRKLRGELKNYYCSKCGPKGKLNYLGKTEVF